MIGYQAGTAVGLKVEEVVNDAEMLKSIDKALAMPPGEFTEITHELVTEGNGPGDEKIFSVRCAPFRGRTDINLGTITVLHDITAVQEDGSDEVGFRIHGLPRNSAAPSTRCSCS